MNSKDRVLTAFAHREPDHVPMWYGAAEGLTNRLIRLCDVPDEEALMQRLRIDFRRVKEAYIGEPLGSRNIWGVERAGVYYGQPMSHPLAGVTTVEEVLAYPHFPSPDWFDFSRLRKQCLAWQDYAIIGGPWVVVFTDATELVGMEEFFIKMYTHPEVMQMIIQKVSDFYYEMAVRTFEAVGGLLDIFFFGDDFGSQQGPLISLKHWRTFAKPQIKRFIDLGHQAGLQVMLHSCGAIRPLIPDMLEIGLDALNPVQPRAKNMDLQELKTTFGERITFHGAMDHQYVLAAGSVEEVRAEVRRVVDIMAPGGGYCLAPSHDLLLDEFPPENIVAMYDEAFEHSRKSS